MPRPTTPSPGCSIAWSPTPPRSGRRPGPWSTPESGLLVLDDSTLDKFHAKKIQMVTRHWSGKHKRVVWGINLITLVWTDGDRVVPCDYRVYDKAKDGLTKNDHFLAMLKRGQGPRLRAAVRGVR